MQKNICRLRKYWRKVDEFVRQPYSGWKERQGALQRMWGSSERAQKRVWEEVEGPEGEVELPSKKRRMVSNWSGFRTTDWSSE